MKLQHVVATLFALASVGAFLFLPARGEAVAFGFAVLAAALLDFKATVSALKGASWFRRSRKDGPDE